jgi:FAD/FMN-containing dehydrogenase
LVRTNLATRMLYSTDASIYQVEPLGVAFPRTADDLVAAVEISASYGVPVLARGSGSSLAGQAVGPALVLDCSRYLYKGIEIDPERRTATVEPGVILNALNRQAKRYGLQFGPDPASSERATVGGSLANNASGAHSILYGLCADHLLSADVVLSDGSMARLESISLEEAKRRGKALGIDRGNDLSGGTEYPRAVCGSHPRAVAEDVAQGFGLQPELPAALVTIKAAAVGTWQR